MRNFDIDELARLVGEGVVTPTGSSAILDDGGTALWVDGGFADIFMVARRGAGEGARMHVARVEAGTLVLPTASDAKDTDVLLRAVGAPSTRLFRVALQPLLDAAARGVAPGIVAAAVDRWFDAFSPERPSPAVDGRELAADGSVVEMADGALVGPQEDAAWLELVCGRAQWLSAPEYGFIEEGTRLPIGTRGWVRCDGAARVRGLSTQTVVSAPDAAEVLVKANAYIGGCILQDHHARGDAAIRRLAQKVRDETDTVDRALRQLAGITAVAATPTSSHPDDPLLSACQLLGPQLQIDFVAHPAKSSTAYARDPVRYLAQAARVRARQVALRGRWWTADHGPLLVTVESSGQPLAALPRAAGVYELVDSVTGQVQRVDASVAQTLAPFATQFYRSFGDRVLRPLEILRFGAWGTGPDLRTLMLMGALAGLLGMVPALAAGTLFDTIIPGADKRQLLHLGLALAGAAIGVAMFELTRGVAVLRMEGRMDTSVQAGVWDRLLALPVPFFRGFTAGDLAARANGISAIRQELSGGTIGVALGAGFSLFNVALLFWYSPTLAWVALFLLTVIVAATASISLAKLRHERQLADLEGRLSGLLLQLLLGIAKLRASGAERRAFGRWAGLFSNHRRLSLRAEGVGNLQETLNAGFPLACSMAVFGTMALQGRDSGLSTGQFIAFNAAFGGLLAALLQMSGALVAVLGVVPLFERARPILHGRPEVDGLKVDPGQLRGDIEITRLSFGYGAESPPILKDISLRIGAGQFVAIVGPSGSGKSTLLRCLLGFEQPSTGAIFYDGQDLSQVDIAAVRRQFGVVLQDGHILPGDIFQNIVGASRLTLDDAWEAARMAGLERDIREMPMGMHTVVSSGALSGGQRQRLLIARAVANRPRILYFDEATSALDNQTQAQVSASLEKLNATRVVIAHRLSTVRNADLIVVLDGGVIKEQGRYDELMSLGGLFSQLAKRQVA